ncbi:sugar phosphate nucleotidyltransferase, partial [Kitasatospora aureofaciens]|uniref:sugar phosphate nucleotidyltransferase n=1 Tax=Kitasatospora aureofaciens TaxID=1894 RepID=UPI0005266F84
TWTATTIAEAINILDAATKQLEAQALALEPGGFHERKEAERQTPIHLAIEFDLTDLIAFHKEKGGLVTVCLTRVPNPLEFGITIVDESGQVERFLEKPTWG